MDHSRSSISLFRSRQRPWQVLRRNRYWGSPLRLLLRLACMLIILMAVVLVVLHPLSWTSLRLMAPKPLPLFELELEGRARRDDSFTNKKTETPESFQFQARLGKAGEEATADPISHYSQPIQRKAPITRPRPRPHGESPASPAVLPTSLQPLQSQMVTNTGGGGGPYHNWPLFSTNYEEMVNNLKIFVHPYVHPGHVSPASTYGSIFLPLADPSRNPKLGNYFSEHAFKVALLHSSLLTERPEEANFFFMPFSINAMRNHPSLRSASSISDFVAEYTTRISSESNYWNASGGADHFYVYCHSIGREAASKHPALRNNAIQITCSSSYFQRLYITHKDIGLPQVWPRQHPQEGQDPAALYPSDRRNIFVFFAGRAQNSFIRQKILDVWSNDTSFAISVGGGSSLPYEEGFKRSKYCLHIRGYEVNTARISDAIHYGCIPVIISNYYDLPFANILDWSAFSIIISEGDFRLVKKILSSVSKQMYQRLYNNLSLVRRHFAWHTTPRSYDAFHMTAYQLWLRRGLAQLTT